MEILGKEEGAHDDQVSANATTPRFENALKRTVGSTQGSTAGSICGFPFPEPMGKPLFVSRVEVSID